MTHVATSLVGRRAEILWIASQYKDMLNRVGTIVAVSMSPDFYIVVDVQGERLVTLKANDVRLVPEK